MDSFNVKIFSAANICKEYPTQAVLNNVNIQIKSGECVGILGNNGSGKSTLLSILSGTLEPTSGDIFINNQPITKAMRRAIAFVPQTPVLVDEISVLDNLKLWNSAYNLGDFKKTYANIPAFLNIDSFYKKRVSTLSGGMKKKLCFAIALMPRLDFLILDEAFSALDAECCLALQSHLQTLKNNGVGIIYCSHNITEIEKICDRLIVLKDGAISFSDTADIFNQPSSHKTIFNHF